VESISDEELDANPQLVKSMSVQPPRGTGRIRTIRIGGMEGAALIDLSPAAARIRPTRRKLAHRRHKELRKKRHHPQGGLGFAE
jgi:hypothetical protein